MKIIGLFDEFLSANMKIFLSSKTNQTYHSFLTVDVQKFTFILELKCTFLCQVQKVQCLIVIHVSLVYTSQSDVTPETISRKTVLPIIKIRKFNWNIYKDKKKWFSKSLHLINFAVFIYGLETRFKKYKTSTM